MPSCESIVSNYITVVAKPHDVLANGNVVNLAPSPGSPPHELESTTRSLPFGTAVVCLPGKQKVVGLSPTGRADFVSNFTALF